MRRLNSPQRDLCQQGFYRLELNGRATLPARKARPRTRFTGRLVVALIHAPTSINPEVHFRVKR